MQEYRDYDEVCRLLSSGARLQMARDSAGNVKLKIKCGPLGLMTRRFKLRFEDAEKLRRDFNLDRY